MQRGEIVDCQTRSKSRVSLCYRVSFPHWGVVLTWMLPAIKRKEKNVTQMSLIWTTIKRNLPQLQNKTPGPLLIIHCVSLVSTLNKISKIIFLFHMWCDVASLVPSHISRLCKRLWLFRWSCISLLMLSCPSLTPFPPPKKLIHSSLTTLLVTRVLKLCSCYWICLWMYGPWEELGERKKKFAWRSNVKACRSA